MTTNNQLNSPEPFVVGKGGTGVTSVTTAPTATAFAGWDANKNLSANSLIEGYTTTATAAATTTLTVSSTFQQFFTGTTTQTVKMPDTSTLVLGQTWYIVNNSTGNVTVQSNGSNNIQVMTAGSNLTITCISTSVNTAAAWNADYAQNGGGGSGTVNSGTANQLAYYQSTGTAVSGLTSANSSVLTTNGSGVPSFTSQILAANLPAGTLFNFQQGQLTTSLSPSNASFADITGLTVSITPTSSSNKVLVRAVLAVSTDATNPSFFQLARGGSAIGVGTSTGSRVACGSETFQLAATVMEPMVLEWLDSPATTSSTTYSVQCQSGGTTYINRSATDTNTSAFGRGASTISVCEVHA